MRVYHAGFLRWRKNRKQMEEHIFIYLYYTLSAFITCLHLYIYLILGEKSNSTCGIQQQRGNEPVSHTLDGCHCGLAIPAHVGTWDSDRSPTLHGNQSAW